MRRYYYSSQCWPIYVIHVPYVSVIVVPSDSLRIAKVLVRYSYVIVISQLVLHLFTGTYSLPLLLFNISQLVLHLFTGRVLYRIDPGPNRL